MSPEINCCTVRHSSRSINASIEDHAGSGSSLGAQLSEVDHLGQSRMRWLEAERPAERATDLAGRQAQGQTFPGYRERRMFDGRTRSAVAQSPLTSRPNSLRGSRSGGGGAVSKSRATLRWPRSVARLAQDPPKNRMPIGKASLQSLILASERPWRTAPAVADAAGPPLRNWGLVPWPDSRGAPQRS